MSCWTDQSSGVTLQVKFIGMMGEMDKRPVAISLFSGGGGLDIGLEDAGFQIKCAIEWNRYACETLRTNKQLFSASDAWFDNWFHTLATTTYKNWQPHKVAHLKARLLSGRNQIPYLQETAIIEGDIKRISSSTILDAAGVGAGEVDLVAGGPPCQSFSRSGKQKSVDDDRGQLFIEFVRIVYDLQPRWFLFENVKGLILTKTTIWKVVCSDCNFEVLPPFNPERQIPQANETSLPCIKCGSKRTRWKLEQNKRAGALELIMAEFERIGYRCQAYILNAVDFGAPQQRERLFIIGSRDNESFGPPAPTHFPIDSVPVLHSQKNAGIQQQRTVWEALFSSPNPDHHWPLDPNTAVLWVKNVVRPHDEPVTWTLLRPSPTIGAHQSAKLAIAPFGVPLEQLIRQQWHVLGRRQGDTKPVPVEHSYLSDADLLKLQTFPSWWYVDGTRMERAFQIGNAVPPILAHAVGRALLEPDRNVAGLGSSKVQTNQVLKKVQQLSLF